MAYITFSINCVLESMRKSLKTECKRLSVAFVSRIRLSNCFSISCVFDSILWEKSWRKRKSWKKTFGKKESLKTYFSISNQIKSIQMYKERSLGLTPESAARDQFALFCRISSSVQGRSHIWASFCELGPFVIPSGNPLIFSQNTFWYDAN